MLTRTLFASLALLLLASPALADETNAGATLERLLADYDRRGGGNTIPIEKEILRLREAGEKNALVRHLIHPRFGATVAWALADDPRPMDVKSILGLARACWSWNVKAAAVSTLAGLPGEEPVALLREFEADAEFPKWARFQLQGALLRRSVDDVVTLVSQGLVAKEVPAVSDALRVIAESYDPRWLPKLAGLTRDERPLPSKVRSRFKVGETQTAADGSTYVRWVQPSLDTVGQLAVEAANRVVSHDTPEMIAWWYELEKGGRFGFGKDAVERIQDTVKLDRKARMREMPTVAEAVEAVLARVRETRPEAETFALASIELKRDGWHLEVRADDETIKATVSEHGTAELG